MARLVKLGVLIKQPFSQWGAPTFIIPKKNGQVRVITDFREGNKQLIWTPYPIPKIATMLQDMEGFTFATSLDLNMGYYTIRLDPDAQKNMHDSSPVGEILIHVLAYGHSWIAGHFPRENFRPNGIP